MSSRKIMFGYKTALKIDYCCYSCCNVKCSYSSMQCCLHGHEGNLISGLSGYGGLSSFKNQ